MMFQHAITIWSAVSKFRGTVDLAMEKAQHGGEHQTT
jgi:hypothetical protein